MVKLVGRVLGAVLVASTLYAGAACAADSADKLVSKYAECLTDPSGALHRTQLANRVGTVPLDTNGMERWLRGSLERGEITMDEMRANYNRHCK